MRRCLYTIFVAGCVIALAACSKDDSTQETVVRQATVTYLVTPNGLGDNGYNDAAAEGIFAFAGETGTRLHLLQPKDENEAETMFRQWLTENAAKDSVVLILGSSAYEQMAQQFSSLTSHFSPQSASRVLLFESDAAIDGVSTVMISHYGVSYLAGAMSQGFDALILAATKGVPALEEAIAGFQEARAAYAGEYGGVTCQTTLHYLADGEAGFAMPDSAYRYIARRAEKAFYYDEMIFPLLGGSEAGVLRCLNDNEFTTALMVGMDVDQTGQSSRIPFSVVIRIGDVLKQYLDGWLAGQEWPQHQRLGMKDGASRTQSSSLELLRRSPSSHALTCKDGAADIVVTPNFAKYLEISDERYSKPDTFQRLYNKYKDEAIRKEEAYEKLKIEN